MDIVKTLKRVYQFFQNIYERNIFLVMKSRLFTL